MALDIATARADVAKLYIAAFDRVPDSAGLDFWVNTYMAGTDTLSTISQKFTSSTEYQTAYPSYLTTAEYVERIYVNVFNRASDATGKAFWVDAITTGKLTNGTLLKAMVDAAGTNGSNDGLMLANQASFGVWAAVNQVPFATANAQLSSITSVATTLTAAQTAVAGSVGSSAGQTFTLTSGADNVAGTSGNDTIKAVVDAQDAALGATSAKVTTIQATDDIKGGSGVDTLTIISSGNVANVVTPLFLADVEKVSVKDIENTSTTTVNLASATGVTEVINDGSVNDIVFQNIGSAAVTVKNLASAGLDTTFTRSAAASVTSALTINLENLGNAAATGNIAAVQVGNVFSTDANNDATAVTVNTTGYVSLLQLEATGNAGAGHTAETVTINAAGTTIFGPNAAAIGIIGFDTTKAGTIVVKGAGAVSLNTLAAVVQTVDASASTGALTVVGTVYKTGTNAAALAAPGLKITGGSGNDSITADGVASAVINAGAGNDTVTINNGTLAAGASIIGGDGTDTISMTSADIVTLSAQTAAGTALRSTISGFEKLSVSNAMGASLNAAQAGSYNYVVLSDDVGAAYNLSGLTTGATIELRNLGVQTGVLSAVVTDAATTSTDVLNIKLAANLTNANSTAQATNKVSIQGINNVNVEAVDRVDDVLDNSAAANAQDGGADEGYTLELTSGANLNKLTITGTSAVSYTLNADTTAVNLIDASASKGNMEIDVSAFAGTERVEIKGSLGTNTITGDDAAFGEKITGGAKADSITGGAGADDMTGNGGRDYFTQGAAASGLTAATIDQITDFGKVTVAATAAEVGAMTNMATFQAAATAKGGADADIIDFTAVTAIASDISTFTTGILAALEAIDATSTEFTGKDISVNSVKGLITLSGADKAMVDTLAEWIAVANLAAEANGETAAFEFSGKTYLFQQQAVGDELIELTGVTGVTGVVLAGGAVAAAVGDVFVL